MKTLKTVLLGALMLAMTACGTQEPEAPETEG